MDTRTRGDTGMTASRKAWFRATREIVGLIQQDVAAATGVTVTTVKRWERRGFPEPPDGVCDWLRAVREDHDRAVEAMVGEMSRGERAVLEIYRSQDDGGIDPVAGGEAALPFGYRNSIARSVAERLALAGVDVTWRYPDEDPGDKTES